MSQKLLHRIALIVLAVFLITVVAYPLIFGTDPHPKNQTPVTLKLSR